LELYQVMSFSRETIYIGSQDSTLTESQRLEQKIRMLAADEFQKQKEKFKAEIKEELKAEILAELQSKHNNS
jgi:hypothetical protein